MRVARQWLAGSLVAALALSTGLTLPAHATTQSRIAGANRYATSQHIQLAGGQPFAYTDRTYFASGENFPDALAAGAAAHVRVGGPGVDPQARPIVLVHPERGPSRDLNVFGEIVLLGPMARWEEQLRSQGKQVRSIAGANRYDTAALLSRDTFASGLSVVYLASGESFPDALTAGPAAAREGAPILLTRKGDLPTETEAELRRLRPGMIIVLGGESAISADVMAQVETVALSERVAGRDRYETAAKLSQRVFPARPNLLDSTRSFLASGESFPDALSGGPLAAFNDAPILLVRRASVPPAVCDELRRLEPTSVTALGGTAAISDEVLAHSADHCASIPGLRGELSGGVTVNGQRLGHSANDEAVLLRELGTPHVTQNRSECWGERMDHAIHRWGDFEVTIMRGTRPIEHHTWPGSPPGSIIGWVIDPTISGDPSRLDTHATGPSGVTIGSLEDQLWGLFYEDEFLVSERVERDDGSWVYVVGESGDLFTVFALAGFRGPVTAMESGFTCG